MDWPTLPGSLEVLEEDLSLMGEDKQSWLQAASGRVGDGLWGPGLAKEEGCRQCAWLDWRGMEGSTASCWQ